MNEKTNSNMITYIFDAKSFSHPNSDNKPISYHPFWLTKMWLLWVDTVSYTRWPNGQVKPWLRQIRQRLKLAVTCISTALQKSWIFVGIMPHCLELTRFTTTLTPPVLLRIHLDLLEQKHQQALIKCGSIRQPVAIRPSPEKWSMEKDRSANKLNFQAVGRDSGVPFSFSYFLKESL